MDKRFLDYTILKLENGSIIRDANSDVWYIKEEGVLKVLDMEHYSPVINDGTVNRLDITQERTMEINKSVLQSICKPKRWWEIWK